MLDFSSALYLGMRHEHGSLQPWAALTTARPASLQPPVCAEDVAKDLARLTGAEQATLGTSTLHLFFDLFEVLAGERIAFCVATGSYPVACWGVDRMAGRGMPVSTFPARDVQALHQRVAAIRSSGMRPVVVADGVNPATGKPVQLDQYLALVQSCHGWLVVDDTQALGILGRHPSPRMPYGHDGGGTAAWHGLQASELIVVCSLAKGFGVPLAVLAGSGQLIRHYERHSLTRMHCSAPSAAHIAAARHALACNDLYGALLRERLAQRIARFRRILRSAGMTAYGNLFPVQTPALGGCAEAMHSALLDQGIRTVLHQARPGVPALISFLITAAHYSWEIDHAAKTLIQAVKATGMIQRSRRKNHEYTADLYPRTLSRI